MHFSLSVCTPQADIVFLIDSSGSIEFNRQGDYQAELNFVTNVINGFGQVGDNGIRVGLVLFGTRAESRFYLRQSTSKEAVTRAVSSLTYLAAETNIAEAFRVAREEQFTAQNGDRPNAPNVIIIVTDGRQVCMCN